METKYESVFDMIAEEAKQLIDEGISLHAIHRRLKHKIPVKTSYTGFYYYVKRKLINPSPF